MLFRSGRARFGSSRNPIWRHGGVAFGPTGIENYTKNMPKSMIRSSIKQALSTKSADVKIVESFTATEFKTKNVVALLEKIGVEGSILIVAGKAEPKFIASARNIAGVRLLAVKQLNVAAIMDADAILFDNDALKELEAWMTNGKKAVQAGDKK